MEQGHPRGGSNEVCEMLFVCLNLRKKEKRKKERKKLERRTLNWVVDFKYLII